MRPKCLRGLALVFLVYLKIPITFYLCIEAQRWQVIKIQDTNLYKSDAKTYNMSFVLTSGWKNLPSAKDKACMYIDVLLTTGLWVL